MSTDSPIVDEDNATPLTGSPMEKLYALAAELQISRKEIDAFLIPPGDLNNPSFFAIGIAAKRTKIYILLSTIQAKTDLTHNQRIALAKTALS